jgi:hypothetical protein
MRKLTDAFVQSWEMRTNSGEAYETSLRFCISSILYEVNLAVVYSSEARN